jgi:ABC-type transporter Mla subunit MlaD
MTAERNAFKLGLTLLMFVVVFCAVLWFLAPRGTGDMQLQVRFPHDRFGTVLKPGGEVLCGGKNVGSVRNLELKTLKDESSNRDELYAVATFLIDSSVGLRKDCRIVPTEALLGGMGALVIKDRGLGEPAKAGDLLEGEPIANVADLTAMLAQQLDPRNPTSLTALIQAQLDPANAKSLMSKIHKSLDDVNMLTRNIAGETDVTQKTALLAKLHEILNNVNETTAALRCEMDGKNNAAAIGKIHQVLDQLNSSLQTARGILDDNREPIRRTVEHVENTSRILEQQIAAKLAEQLDTSNAAGLLARIHVAIERLGHSIEDVNSITSDVRDVIALNKNNLDVMLTNLKETSDHLKAGSKEIRLNPWLLLYTPKPNEFAESQLFGAARAFSEGATRLDDAVTRLEAISRSPAGNTPENREELEKIRAQLNETFQKFNQAEQKLWEQLHIK